MVDLSGQPLTYSFPSPDSVTMKCPLLKKAFTLIELLVVIAIIAILASLLLPVLKTAKDKGIGVRCMSNYRQLQFAWHMYSGDNRDWITGNNWPDEKAHVQNENWLSGWMDPLVANNNDNFDTTLFMDPKYGQLGPYTVNPKLYLCAASRVQAQKGPSLFSVVRTVSMSVWMGYTTVSPVPPTRPFAKRAKSAERFRQAPLSFSPMSAMTASTTASLRST